MLRYFVISAFLASLLFSSCSFNRTFLNPFPIPDTVKKWGAIDYRLHDTLHMLVGEKYQPTFLNTDYDTVHRHFHHESVVFNNKYGNRLNGWVITPKENYNGITLLLLHGNSGNITTYYQRVVPLAEQGFRVFLFDYSGFGWSKGKAKRKKILYDAQAAFDYLLSHKGESMDWDYLFIYGQSLGGHLAPAVAVRNKGKVDGVIVEGAFSSPDDVAVHFSGLGFFARMVTRQYFTAVKSIKKFDKPVLIIHSTEDSTIPFFMGEKIYANANQPKEFLKIDKCHICGPVFYPGKIKNEIIEMTEKVAKK